MGAPKVVGIAIVFRGAITLYDDAVPTSLRRSVIESSERWGQLGQLRIGIVKERCGSWNGLGPRWPGATVAAGDADADISAPQRPSRRRRRGESRLARPRGARPEYRTSLNVHSFQVSEFRSRRADVHWRRQGRAPRRPSLACHAPCRRSLAKVKPTAADVHWLRRATHRRRSLAKASRAPRTFTGARGARTPPASESEAGRAGVEHQLGDRPRAPILVDGFCRRLGSGGTTRAAKRACRA